MASAASFGIPSSVAALFGAVATGSSVSWATVAAIASAVAAVFATVVSFYVFVETRRMRLAQTEPHVSVSVVQSEFAFGFADLVIRNDGPGAATDVKFEVVVATPGDPDAEVLQALSNLGLVTHGVAYLASGAEFRTYIARIVGRSKEALRTNVHLRIRYKSSMNQAYASCYPVELLHFENRTRIGTPPIPAIAKELEVLRKEVSQIRQLMQREEADEE